MEALSLKEGSLGQESLLVKCGLHMGIEIPNQKAANDDGAEKHDGEKDGDEKLNESVARARLAGKRRGHFANTFLLEAT